MRNPPSRLTVARRVLASVATMAATFSCAGPAPPPPSFLQTAMQASPPANGQVTTYDVPLQLQPDSVSCLGGNATAVFACVDDHLFHTRDSGRTWQLIPVEDFGRPSGSLFVENDTVFVSPFHSADSGKTFRRVSHERGSVSFLTRPIATGGMVYFLGRRGGDEEERLYVGARLGAEWTSTALPRPVGSKLPGPFHIYARGERLYGVLGSTIFRFEPGQQAWTPQADVSNPIPRSPWTAIADVLYAVSTGPPSGVYRSTDGGASWSYVPGLVGVSGISSGVVFNGAHYLATSLGVYSGDPQSSERWTEVRLPDHRTGLERARWDPVRFLLVSGRTLLAAGAGVYGTEDGVSWDAMASGLGYRAFSRAWATSRGLVMLSASGAEDRADVYYSTGPAAPWQKTEPVPERLPYRLNELRHRWALTSEAVYYLATGDGIYRKRHDEKEWGLYRKNEPSSRLWGIAAAGDALLYLASDGLFRADTLASAPQPIGPPPPTSGDSIVTLTATADRVLAWVATRNARPPSADVVAFDHAAKSWSSAASGLEPGIVDKLVAGGARVFALSASSRQLHRFTDKGQWQKLPAEGLTGEIRDVWADPASTEFIVAATGEGLFWSNNGGSSFRTATRSATSREFRGAAAIVTFEDQVFAAGDSGLVAIVNRVPQGTMLSRAFAPVRAIVGPYADSWWFRGVTSAALAYVGGLASLLIIAWSGGSRVFGRSRLASYGSKPLLITPGIAKRLLFIGYRRRLSRMPPVASAATESYFGLPCDGPRGAVLPDSSGDALHGAIADALHPQQPALIFGDGGSGKTRVLARLTHGALGRTLPPSLRRLRPILIPAVYYEGSLVGAAAAVLRERDGVGVDEDTTRAQLEAGGFLVLFDGVSEVEGDQRVAFQEILRTAKHADFAGNRFVISSRPPERAPEAEAIFTLRPLTRETVALLLPTLSLSREAQSGVRRSLEHFGDRPISPLLFSMLVGQGGHDWSRGRAGLYELYFRRLLRVTGSQRDEEWNGWRSGLEVLAQWFLLDSGHRGVGLPRATLMDLLADSGAGQGRESLVARLKRLYGLPVDNELAFLRHLRNSGILDGTRRWRFVHDTFEEYFAAGRLITLVEDGEPLPLGQWESPEQQHGFVGVVDFLVELAPHDGQGTPLEYAAQLPEPLRSTVLRRVGPTL